MNKESNVYTIIFATVMVVIVGGLLAFVSSSLKPAQIANVKNEKMQNVLRAIDPSFKLGELKAMSRPEIVELFNQHVKERIIIDYNGEAVFEAKTSEDEIDPKNVEDAFNLNPRKKYATISNITKGCNGDVTCIKSKMIEAKIYSPLFICEKEGETVYVTHFSGKGLWDDVWGYVGIKSSRRVNAAVFDHKGETPGLGSVITADWFQDQYIDKLIEDESAAYKPIKVFKPGKELNDFSVQGISGATFTGVGVDEMMGRGLVPYYNYFKKNVEKEEESVGGSTEVYALGVTKENVLGDWESDKEVLTLKVNNIVLNGNDYGYSLMSDSLVVDPAGTNVLGKIIAVYPKYIQIRWSNREFATTYDKQ
jgi:Na+-transporting NADH:ubiquinone oxidoreductase subunit C